VSAARAPRDSASSSLRAFEAIHEHAELELELAGRGDIAGLATLGERWQELLAALPPTVPATALPLLERARLLHERTRVELQRLRELLQAELVRTAQARRTANGYAGQLPRRPRLDRSA